MDIGVKTQEYCLSVIYTNKNNTIFEQKFTLVSNTKIESYKSISQQDYGNLAILLIVRLISGNSSNSWRFKLDLRVSWLFSDFFEFFLLFGGRIFLKRIKNCAWSQRGMRWGAPRRRGAEVPCRSGPSCKTTRSKNHRQLMTQLNRNYSIKIKF